ncbi:hypothetical protein MTR_2g020480 [Medicago truncatula]|uniref:Uncharacterized protein n=1 Tax=Medicago truncatula TaxID=3880 RepID=G7ISL7_MEDTR|nr:hypothetical protein MTR_2g020480 [Medicago truncatula]
MKHTPTLHWKRGSPTESSRRNISQNRKVMDLEPHKLKSLTSDNGKSSATPTKIHKSFKNLIHIQTKEAITRTGLLLITITLIHNLLSDPQINHCPCTDDRSSTGTSSSTFSKLEFHQIHAPSSNN